MQRSLLLAGAIVFAALTQAGCYYYVDEPVDDTYTYCDETGCYWCDDWGCYPDGDASWTCDNNYDCAAGCYCSTDGFCEEAGFCYEDAECPSGFVCDNRSSCVPEGGDSQCTADEDCQTGTFCDEASGQCIDSSTCTNDPTNCPDGYTCDTTRGTCEPSTCTQDSECAIGSYCDVAAGECVVSTECIDDTTCQAGTECDTERNTCVPDQPDPILCQAEVTCDTVPPVCAEGTNPGIQSGCYTGECVADADCPDGAPVYCSDHATEDVCLADDACAPVYRGINCTDPMGQSCTSDESNCTCESFAFHECTDV